MLDINDQFTGYFRANIQASQRFAMFALETAQKFFLLQARSYQAMFTGGADLAQTAAEWQRFVEESTRKTVELTSQRMDSFARMKTNVAHDAADMVRTDVHAADRASEPLQYSKSNESGRDKGSGR